VGSSVWVFTQRLDSTADVVIQELNRRGVPVARFDLDEITVTAELDGDHWVGSLSTPSRTVELDDVAGIYYRRPSPASAPPNVDLEAVEWVEAEIRWGAARPAGRAASDAVVQLASSGPHGRTQALPAGHRR
jgi:hypothetical protein